VGWFPAELLDEIRLARAADLAHRPNGATALDQRILGLARQADVSARFARSGSRLGVALTAGIGRMFGSVSLILRVLILVWLAERVDAAAVVVGVVIIGVLLALRLVVANCLARRWNGWAGAAMVGYVAVVGGTGAWAWLSGGRPLMVGLLVLAELAAWVSLVIMAQARLQAGPDLVVT
jgi:hypothetical protein